jgi:hypothetical protein
VLEVANMGDSICKKNLSWSPLLVTFQLTLLYDLEMTILDDLILGLASNTQRVV